MHILPPTSNFAVISAGAPAVFERRWPRPFEDLLCLALLWNLTFQGAVFLSLSAANKGLRLALSLQWSSFVDTIIIVIVVIFCASVLFCHLVQPGLFSQDWMWPAEGNKVTFHPWAWGQLPEACESCFSCTVALEVSFKKSHLLAWHFHV